MEEGVLAEEEVEAVCFGEDPGKVSYEALYEYRMPLLLHHLEGYSLPEVGEMLGIPAKLVKSRLHQARKALREALEEDGDPI